MYKQYKKKVEFLTVDGPMGSRTFDYGRKDYALLEWSPRTLEKIVQYREPDFPCIPIEKGQEEWFDNYFLSHIEKLKKDGHVRRIRNFDVGLEFENSNIACAFRDPWENSIYLVYDRWRPSYEEKEEDDLLLIEINIYYYSRDFSGDGFVEAFKIEDYSLEKADDCLYLEFRLKDCFEYKKCLECFSFACTMDDVLPALEQL